jgi:hypothetical protein
MSMFSGKKWLAWSVLMLVVAFIAALPVGAWQAPAVPASSREADAVAPTADGDYVVLTWNDLGMHCYNRDFRDLAVLPPYNTLWAQVIRVGDPPQIVTSGIRVRFHFADNTYSIVKSNFWSTSPYRTVQNAQWLFNLRQPLPNNIGLTGVGMAGEMELHGDHWVAEGIPLTEFRDSDPTNPYPYQVATVVVYDASTGLELARAQPVAPVSTEMHCDFCHYDGGVEGIATGRVETNILTLHDEENMDEYPPLFSGPLMNRRPVLCAWCHASNALGMHGVAGMPNLSRAMHEKHAEELPTNQQDCYNCHPGPQTQCLRDVMSTRHDMVCEDCHGSLAQVGQEGREPWLEEPTCTDLGCHESSYQQNQALYRMSKEHGSVYCAACHDSPHAIAPSREDNDAIKFIAWQGHNGPLDICVVCHASLPTGAGPHGHAPRPVPGVKFEPDHFTAEEPGATVVFTHMIENRGNLDDTYDLTWSSSLGWLTSVTPEISPLTLSPGQSALVTVVITIPNNESVRGQTDRTTLTATSTISPTLVVHVADRTMVPRAYLYLPFVWR